MNHKPLTLREHARLCLPIIVVTCGSMVGLVIGVAAFALIGSCP